MVLLRYFLTISLYMLIFGCSPDKSAEPTIATLDFSSQTAEVSENPDFRELFYTLNFSSNVDVKFTIITASHPEAILLSESTGDVQVKTLRFFNFEENPTMSFQIRATANEKTVTATLTINLIDIEFEERFAGNVVLSSQEQVNTFCANNYLTITGSLNIGGTVPPGETPITTLLPFSALSVVESYVTIDRASQLTSLEGFESLEEIKGKLTINLNAKLTSMSGLSNLAIDGEFRLSNNNLLVNFDGVENINVVNAGVSISGNRTLTEIHGFETTLMLTGLSIRSNEKLSTINGFSNITSIRGRFTIENCPALENLELFPNLTEVTGTFKINENTSLELIRFEGLETIEGLSIGGNDLLQSVQFDRLSTVSGGLGFSHNPNLLNIQGFDALTQISGLYVNNNPALPSLQAFQGLTAITGPLNVANSYLNNLEGLEGLSTIGGDLILENNSFENLSGLNNLIIIQGGLSITNNQIENLTGLGNLTSIDSMDLIDSPMLMSFAGLENLENINGLLYIVNTGIVDLNFGETLATMDGISISANQFLESVSGINEMPNNLGRLTIYDNPILSSINIANSATKVLALRIDQNRSLMEMNSLGLLQTIDLGLYIHDNGPLQSIDGMGQLTYIGSSFEISQNTQFTDFCNFTGLINSNGIQNDYIVNSNAYNPSIADIIAGDCSL